MYPYVNHARAAWPGIIPDVYDDAITLLNMPDIDCKIWAQFARFCFIVSGQ
jgi:hypothetical protein